MAAQRTVHVGLNLSPTEDLRVAALPLLEASEVDALELSVDLAFHGVPEWADALLGFYAYEGRLVGHGVELSLFSAGQDERRAAWLSRLDEVWRRYRMTHLSEHFGFMTAGDFVGGTPLPLPFTKATLELGRRNLSELKDHLGGAPVGLENLAFALSARDVDEQPDFLEALLSPVDGFLHLDLHNLYCHAENYDRDPSELLRRYPLERVVKIHLAGGNHFVSGLDPTRPFRRDDHERDVPARCLALLEEALGLCPRLEYVILEHADHALSSAQAIDDFRATYRRVRQLVSAASSTAAEPPPPPAWGPPHDSEDDPGAFETGLLECLDQTADVDEAQARLTADERLDPFRPWVDAFDPRALELGRVLVDRWGERRTAVGAGEVRAAVLEAPTLLRFRSVPTPSPGDGQVRLRIEAAGVCGTDVHLWRGIYGAKALPLVLGHEAVGVVDEVGPGVVSPRVGERVGVPWAQESCGRCAQCVSGKHAFCTSMATWMTQGGFFADAALVRASACVAIPDGLSSVEAAPFFCAGHTAFAALEVGGAVAGNRVAIIGVGGLGHLAIQLAAQRGCEVFAITSDPSKVDVVKRLGAAAVLTTDDAAESLARAGGADLIVSTTSDPGAAGGLVAALRPAGVLALAGLGETPLAFDAAALVQRGASIQSVVPGDRAQLTAALTLAAEGRVTPIIELYPFGQLRRVLFRLADSRVRYRAVIELGSTR